MSTSQQTKNRPGRIHEITSTANPQIKAIKSLAAKKFRDETGLFLAEGLKLLTDALATGWPVRIVIFAKKMAGVPAIANAAARARAQGADILEVNEKILGAISRRDNPQMVIGVYEQRFAAPPKQGASSEFWIALDRVRDPGNLGTIIRTADCVGANGVMLVGEVTDPFGLEAVRATMGSLFHMKLVKMSADGFADWCKGWNGRVIGAHLEGAVDFRSIELGSEPAILLMGNEQQGLPVELSALCDTLCLIPMAGQADSLNLAVSTGIVAFQLRRDVLIMPDQSKGTAS